MRGMWYGAGIVAATLSACLPPVGDYDRGEIVLDCCGGRGVPVALTYLGVGGFLIQTPRSVVLTAPLFSNPSIGDAGLSEIFADADRIRAHLPAEAAGAAAILVGHGHYDHLMDVPWIADSVATAGRVYGNATVAHQLAPFGLRRGSLTRRSDGELEPAAGGGRVVVVAEALGDRDRPGDWIRVAPDVRVMPLRSDHAPHLAGVTLYDGERERDMERAPRSANEWLAGDTYAYLIDVLAPGGGVALRVYYQDAVAAEPYGLVPPLADGVRVDLALLVPATYAEVSWHPEAILESADPRHVILAHWEDFFLPPSREPEPVPFTLLPDFVRRLERALAGRGVEHHLPVPHTRFVVRP